MTREEFTKLCDDYLNLNDCNIQIQKCPLNREISYHINGMGLVKYTNRDASVSLRDVGVYFPYGFKYYKISGNVIVNKKDGKSPAWMWTDYIKLGLMEDAEIRRRIVKLSENIRTMMKKIKKDQIKNAGAEYEIV